MNFLLAVSVLAVLVSQTSSKIFRASLLSMQETQTPKAEILLQQDTGETPDEDTAQASTDAASSAASSVPASTGVPIGYIPGTPGFPTPQTDITLVQVNQDSTDEPAEEATEESAEEPVEETGQEAGEETSEEAGEETSEETKPEDIMSYPIKSIEATADSLESLVAQLQTSISALSQMLGMSAVKWITTHIPRTLLFNGTRIVSILHIKLNNPAISTPIRVNLKSENHNKNQEIQIYCVNCKACIVQAPRNELLFTPEPKILVSPGSAITESETPITYHKNKVCICEYCGKDFSRRSALENHKRKHTGEKPFECLTCGKAFSEKGNLKTHERTHTGEKPFECEFCNRKFTTKGHLVDHLRKHNNERPYSCDICSNSYSRSSILKVHKRTHTGERPYKCLICHKSFSESGNLRTHMRVHTNERPYICKFPDCCKSFKTKGQLSDHMKTRKHADRIEMLS